MVQEGGDYEILQPCMPSNEKIEGYIYWQQLYHFGKLGEGGVVVLTHLTLGKGVVVL